MTETASTEINLAKIDRKRLFDILALAGIVIFTLALVLIRMKIQYLPGRGPAFDTYALLDNALTMAGKSTYFEIGRPPVMPFLMSLFFRIGLTTETVAYSLDGLSLIFGAVGLYLLIKQRMKTAYALAGALLFVTLPEVVLNVTMGMTDIMAVSLSIWMIYFLILGLEKPRFYLLVLPLFTVAFLTRYTAAVMIFPLMFIIFRRGVLLKHLKTWLIGAAVSLVLLGIDIVYLWTIAGDQALVQFISPFKTATTVTPALTKTAIQPIYEASSYFVRTLPEMLGGRPAGWLLSAALTIGFLAFAVNLYKKRRVKRFPGMFIVTCLLVVPLALSLMTYNFLVTDAVIVGLFLVLISSRFDTDKETLVDIVILIWLISFFSYHSHQSVKVARYFLTMAPQAAFIIVLGFSFLSGLLKERRGASAGIAATAVFTTILILISCVTVAKSYNAVVAIGRWGMPEDVKAASDWLRPRLSAKSKIYSDYYVALAWFLRKPIIVMPIYADPRAVEHELTKYDADYFVSIWQSKNMSYYSKKTQYGTVSIFAPNNRSRPDKPRILFIGQDLDHYIEDILQFRYYVVRRLSPFADDATRAIGTTFLDGYSLADLKEYPTILLYNFRWRDIETSEDTFLAYVEQGGTIIIDTSGNSGNYLYDLDNGSLFSISIVNASLSKNAPVSIVNSSAVNSADINTSRFAPWVDENGNPWKGSTYRQTSPGRKASIHDTATVDKQKLLIGTMNYGKGKIVWIGYNFMFHAFYYKNTQERNLVRGAFSAAIPDSR